MENTMRFGDKSQQTLRARHFHFVLTPLMCNVSKRSDTL